MLLVSSSGSTGLGEIKGYNHKSSYEADLD